MDVLREMTEEYLGSLAYVREIPRAFRLPEAAADIVAVVGPRRVGKTFTLLKRAAELRARGEQVLYVTFDDPWAAALDERRLAEEARRLYPAGRIHLFLDEVQEWPHWDRRLRWLHDVKDFHIYATGSTSELSADRVPARLRGRYVSRLLLPLSFREVAGGGGAGTFRDRGPLRRLLEEYARWGGFPEVWLWRSPDKVRSLLDTMFYRDIVERRRVRDVEAFRRVFQAVVENFANPVTWRSLARAAGGEADPKTAAAYVRYMEEAYLVFTVERYGTARRRARAPRKLYLVDPALATGLPSLDAGRRLENLVFLHLLRRSLEEGGRIYYLQHDGEEVDFVYLQGDMVRLYEAAYQPDERHARKLARARERLRAAEAVLISWDSEDHGAVPAWRWLLQR